MFAIYLLGYYIKYEIVFAEAWEFRVTDFSFHSFTNDSLVFHIPIIPVFSNVFNFPHGKHLKRFAPKIDKTVFFYI